MPTKCDWCGRFGAVTYHQRTNYEREEDNLVTLCPKCREKNDDYWDEIWDGYNSSRL